MGIEDFKELLKSVECLPNVLCCSAWEAERVAAGELAPTEGMLARLRAQGHRMESWPETRSPDSMPWKGELPQALRLEMESLVPSLAACFHETVEPWNRLDVHNCLKHWGGWYFYEDSPGSSHPNKEDADLIANCRFYIAALLHEVHRLKEGEERSKQWRNGNSR